MRRPSPAVLLQRLHVLGSLRCYAKSRTRGVAKPRRRGVAKPSTSTSTLTSDGQPFNGQQEQQQPEEGGDDWLASQGAASKRAVMMQKFLPFCYVPRLLGPAHWPARDRLPQGTVPSYKGAVLRDDRNPLQRPMLERMVALRSPPRLFNWNVSAGGSALRPVVRNWLSRRVKAAFLAVLKGRGLGANGQPIGGRAAGRVDGLRRNADVVRFGGWRARGLDGDRFSTHPASGLRGDLLLMPGAGFVTASDETIMAKCEDAFDRLVVRMNAGAPPPPPKARSDEPYYQWRRPEGRVARSKSADEAAVSSRWTPG